MTSYPRIILKKGKEEPVRRFHPWIFSGAVDLIEEDAGEGDIVEIFSYDRKYLATGYLLSGSIIIKILSFERRKINREFWHDRLLSSYKLRKDIGLVDSHETNTYRLIHNEGDFIPGLIIDIYNNLAVIQAHSLAVYKQAEMISEVILELFEGRINAVYNKSAESLRKMTGLIVCDGYITGKDQEYKVMENGSFFYVNPATGQKTGLFLDQRENRQLLGMFAPGKKVLNMFGYTGGFSVSAARAGASHVCTVDSSAHAIAMAEKNMGLNGFLEPIHTAIVADAREYLDAMAPGSYDLIILDPPAFAKNMDSRKKALSGYRFLNEKALKKITTGGIMFTFSCSQVVDRQMFTSAVTTAAIDAGRTVRIIHHLSQPPDHPVNIFHQEGEYLKGLVLRVE
jgi:23S rRNA (cytosine1962-C5)-methyltransferase